MSNVVAIESMAAEPERPSHRRLRLLSRGLAYLFSALLIVCVLEWALMVVIVTFYSADVQTSAYDTRLDLNLHGKIPAAVPGMVRLSDQPPITRLAAAIDFAFAISPIFFVFWHLRGLFRLYAAGTVFARENAMHLKYVGLWLMAYMFVKLAANMIFRLAGGLDHAWFHMEELDALVLGMIVFVIALVMEFGREIEQEKDSFI